MSEAARASSFVRTRRFRVSVDEGPEYNAGCTLVLESRTPAKNHTRSRLTGPPSCTLVSRQSRIRSDCAAKFDCRVGGNEEVFVSTQLGRVVRYSPRPLNRLLPLFNRLFWMMPLNSPYSAPAPPPPTRTSSPPLR